MPSKWKLWKGKGQRKPLGERAREGWWKNVTLKRQYGRKYCDFEKLLEKEIKPKDKVLVTAPGTIFGDPSTYAVSNIVRDRGQLLIVDVPTLKGLRPKGMAVEGGLDEFKEDWKSRTKKDLPVLIGGTGGHIPIKAGKMDVIYDHDALYFLEKYGGYPRDMVLREYLRVLKPGGKIMLACSKEIHFPKREIRREMIAGMTKEGKLIPVKTGWLGRLRARKIRKIAEHPTQTVWAPEDYFHRHGLGKGITNHPTRIVYIITKRSKRV